MFGPDVHPVSEVEVETFLHRFRWLSEALAAWPATQTDNQRELGTLRKALRRMLEHHWEGLAELSRRPGGPAL